VLVPKRVSDSENSALQDTVPFCRGAKREPAYSRLHCAVAERARGIPTALIERRSALFDLVPTNARLLYVDHVRWRALPDAAAAMDLKAPSASTQLACINPPKRKPRASRSEIQPTRRWNAGPNYSR
jgi:hypothetical protein